MATYDLRRSSAAQGIPAKASPQGNQGFDSEGFGGPAFETPEQRRERLRREEEERKKRKSGGLLSDIGSLISEGFSKARSGAGTFAELSTFGTTEPEFQQAWMDAQADTEARKDALLTSYLQTYNEHALATQQDDDPTNDQRTFDLTGMGPDISIPALGSGKMQTPKIGFNTGNITQAALEELTSPINVGIGAYGRGASAMFKAGSTKLGSIKSGIQTPALTKAITTRDPTSAARGIAGTGAKAALTTAQAPLQGARMLIEPIAMREASIGATIATEVAVATAARRTFENVYDSEMLENRSGFVKAALASLSALAVGGAAAIKGGQAIGKLDPTARRAAKEQLQRTLDENALEDTIEEMDFIERRNASGNEIVPVPETPVHVASDEIVYVGLGRDGRPVLKDDGTLYIDDIPNSGFGGRADDAAVVRRGQLDMTPNAYQNQALPDFSEGTLRGSLGQNITRPKSKEGLLRAGANKLYHVTNQGAAIRNSGVVRAITPESAGLQGGGFGGSARGSVSTTPDREMAEHLQTELRRRIEISRAQTPEEVAATLRSWVDADTAKAGTDSPILDASEVTAIVEASQLRGGTAQLAAYDSYLMARKRTGIDLFTNETMPVVFRDTAPKHDLSAEEYAQLNPNDIEIIDIDTNLIPDDAFIKTWGVRKEGSTLTIDDPDALFETEIFADVAVPRTDQQLPLPIPPKSNADLRFEMSGPLEQYIDSVDSADFTQAVRRAQIQETLDQGTASHREILDLIKKERQYMLSDGTTIDWDEVPMLNTSTEMGRLIFDENVRRVELGNVYLMLRMANWEENIFGPKDIILPSEGGLRGGVTQKVSLSDLVQDGRWNPRLKELGIMDLKDGMYSFHGAAGRQIEAKLKAIRDELDLNLDIDRVNGLEPEELISDKFKEIPDNVKMQMDAMWESGEMPYFGDVIERSLGEYKGYFPRFVTNPQKGITGFGGSHVNATYDKNRAIGYSLDPEGNPIGEYERQLWEMADDMGLDPNNPVQYLLNPQKIMGARLKATLDKTNAKWVEDAALASPAFDGLGGYTVLERMRMDYRHQQAMDRRDDALKNVKNILGRLTRAKSIQDAEVRRLAGVDTQRAAVLAQSSGLIPSINSLRAVLIANGTALLKEINEFLPDAELLKYPASGAGSVEDVSLRRAGIPFSREGRELSEGVPVRESPKQIDKLKSELAEVQKKVNDAAGESIEGPKFEELWESIESLRRNYEVSLDIYDNFLKGRPAVKRSIRAQSTFDAQTNRSNHRTVREEYQSIESQVANIQAVRALINAQIADVEMARPSGLPQLRAQWNRDLASLEEAQKQLEWAKGMYDSAYRAAGNGSLEPLRDSLLTVQQPVSVNGRGLLKPDGSPVMETIVHPSAAQSGRVRFLDNHAMRDVLYDDAFADQLDKVFRKDLGGQSVIEQTWNQLNDVLRTLNASGDMSGLTIQGLTGAGLTPPQYVAAVMRSMAAVAINKKFYTRWMLSKEDTIRDMTRYRGHMADPDGAGEFIVPKQALGFRLSGDVQPRRRTRKTWDALYRKARKSTQVLPQKDPLTGKDIIIGSLQGALYVAEKPVSVMLNASNLHFSAFGNMMRVYLWENATANKKTFDILRTLRVKGGGPKKEVFSHKEKRELAESINNLTGWSKGEPTTIERTALFAPRFFRAQNKNLIRMIDDAGPAGDLAREAYFRTILMAATLTAGLNYMLGQPTDWQPVIRNRDGTYRRNNNFMRVHTENRDISLLGPLDSQMALWFAVALNQGTPIEAQLGAFSGKRGAAFDKGVMLLSQQGFGGEPMPRPILPTDPYAEASWEAKFNTVEELGRGFLPFWMQGELQEMREFDQSLYERYIEGGPPVSLPLNIIGGKEAPKSVREEVLGIARMRNPDGNYNLDDKPVPAWLRDEIFDDNPVLKARWARLGDQYDEAGRTKPYEWSQTQILEAQAERDVKLSQFGTEVLMGLKDRSLVPRHIGDIQSEYFERVKGLRTGNKEFENAAGGALFFEMAEKMYEAYDRASAPYTGLDFDKLQMLQDGIREEYGPAISAQYDDYVKKTKYPPTVQEIMEAGTYLRESGYWGTPEDVFAKALFVLPERSSFREAAQSDNRSAKELVDEFSKLLTEEFGRPIKTLDDLETAARLKGQEGKWQYRELMSGFKQELKDARDEMARNDINIDMSRVQYLGAYPAINLETTSILGLGSDLNVPPDMMDANLADNIMRFLDYVENNPAQAIDVENLFANPQVAWKWVQLQQLLKLNHERLNANWRASQGTTRPEENPTGMGLTSEVESDTRSWARQMQQVIH